MEQSKGGGDGQPAMSSDESTGTESGSESSDSESQFSKKKLRFKKPAPKKTDTSTDNRQIDVESKAKETVVATITKNLKRLEKQQHGQTQGTVLDERSMCADVDDTDTNSSEDREAWKRRELDRLHRDRNERIARESAM